MFNLKNMELGYKKQISLPFQEAVEKTKDALAKVGFGIITEIDVKETFRKKLDVDFENYMILGACHPASAFSVLQTDKELGLLLPCNVVVYEDKKKINVSAILPTVAMSMVGRAGLESVAKEIEEKLKEAVDSI